MRLTEKQWEYMELYLIQGMDVYQIGARCGRCHSTVSRTLQRGWHKVRLHLLKKRPAAEVHLTVDKDGSILKMASTRTDVLLEGPAGLKGVF